MGNRRFWKLLGCATAISVVALAAPTSSSAAFLYPSAGFVYTQDFNTLPTTPENTSLQATIPWTDDSTSSATQTSLPGWYLWHALNPGTESGANGHQRFRIGHGTETTGSFYSYGSTSSTDRALGDLGSTTIAQNSPGDQTVAVLLRLTNNTADTLNSFTLTYTGEQWRNNGNTATDTMFFGYSTDATASNNGTFLGVSALDFTSPIATATAAALDGNNAANRSTKTATVTGFSWVPGTDLWLRWNDLQIGGNDHALAIDDVSFSAINDPNAPEPASIALLLMGAPTVLGMRRRRSK